MAEPRFSYTDQVKTPYNSIAGRPLAKAEIGGEKTNYYYDPKATDFYIPLDPNLLDLTPPIQANSPQCNLFQGSALASSSSSGNSRTLVSSAGPVSAASCHAASSHWGFFNNADFTDRPSSTITSQSGAGTTSYYSRSSSRAMLSDGASPTVPMLNMPIEVDAFYNRFFNPSSSDNSNEGIERTIVSPNADTEAVLFDQLGLKPAQQKSDPTLIQNIFYYLPDPNDTSVQRGMIPRANFCSTTGVYNPNAPTVYVPLTPELLGSGATYQLQLDPKVDLEHRQIANRVLKPVPGITQVAMQVTNKATGAVTSLPALRRIPLEVKITPVDTGYVYTPEGARYIQPPFATIDTSKLTPKPNSDFVSPRVFTEAWSYGFNPSIKLSPFNPGDLLDFPGLTDNAKTYAFFNSSPKILTPQQLQRVKEIVVQLGKDARDLLLGILYEYVSSNTDLIRQLMPIYQLNAKDAERLEYELRRQSPYFQAGRVIGSSAAIAQGLFEFVIGTGGDIAGGSACATVVGCTVGAPTIAGSVALQVHGATTAVAGAKNLGKVLSEIYSVVFASSSTSGAGNNPSGSSSGSTSPQRQSKLDGDDFEKAVSEALREPLNTQKVTGNVRGKPRNTEPDLNSLKTGIVDIKNVENLSFTKQLQAQADYARNVGKPFSLIVGPKTKAISEPLQTTVRNGGGVIVRFDPVARKFSKVKFNLNRVLP